MRSAGPPASIRYSLFAIRYSLFRLSHPNPLLRLALLELGARRADFLARADLGNADLPPGIARGPLMRLNFHDDDRGAVGLLGAGEGLFELADRMDRLGMGAH